MQYNFTLSSKSVFYLNYTLLCKSCFTFFSNFKCWILLILLGKLFQCLRISYKCSSNIKCWVLDLAGKKQKMKRSLKSLSFRWWPSCWFIFYFRSQLSKNVRTQFSCTCESGTSFLLKYGHLSCGYQLEMRESCQWAFPACVLHGHLFCLLQH